MIKKCFFTALKSMPEPTYEGLEENRHERNARLARQRLVEGYYD